MKYVEPSNEELLKDQTNFYSYDSNFQNYPSVIKENNKKIVEPVDYGNKTLFFILLNMFSSLLSLFGLVIPFLSAFVGGFISILVLRNKQIRNYPVNRSWAVCNLFLNIISFVVWVFIFVLIFD